jgi:hypothetical protein
LAPRFWQLGLFHLKADVAIGILNGLSMVDRDAIIAIVTIITVIVDWRNDLVIVCHFQS